MRYKNGFTADSRLEDVKLHLRANFDEGCACPACGQFVKRYKRKLNAGVAVFLIGLYRLHMRGASDIHINDVAAELKRSADLKPSSDYGILKHWELIAEVPKPGSDNDRKTSGVWKITKKGLLFAEGREAIPKYLFIFNQQPQGFSFEQTTIIEALGQKFNYNELMEGI